MKKAKSVDQLETRQDEPTDKFAARIIPLRSETVLSRRPIHRLSKRGSITIEETKRNAQRKVISSWVVRNPPGPLAYKVDSLIITRRIEESRPNVPKLLQLGSLSEMCRELHLADSGKNRNDLKEAIHQNASAYIIARLEYDDKDGTKRTFEFGSSRYGVFFVGETLPNGKRADAVYVYFHDVYLNLINRAPTRPLDYEYLRQLTPAAQRLYELLSFAFFGAIKHGRNCATYLYSDLCASAPLTRYYEWERARKQLYKLHRPHIESEYLEAVGFEETTDAEGQPDWIIRYTPGNRARREFKEFTKKKEERREDPAPKPSPRLAPAASPDLLMAAADRADAVLEYPLLARLIERLVATGFGRSAATDLASEYPEECDRQLNALPARNLSAVRDRIAWLRCAIREGYSTPAAPEQGSPAALEAEQAIAQAKQANAEKAVSCELCRNTASWRPVKDPTNPKGYSFKQCSHNPEKESKYEPAW